VDEVNLYGEGLVTPSVARRHISSSKLPTEVWYLGLH